MHQQIETVEDRQSIKFHSPFGFSGDTHFCGLFVFGVNDCNQSSLGVFFETFRCDRKRHLNEANSLSWSQTEVVGSVDLSKVTTFDVDGLCKRNFVRLD